MQQDLTGLINRISSDLSLSNTLTIELAKLLEYCEVSGVDIPALTDKIYAAGVLPADKKHGKEIYERLRKDIKLGNIPFAPNTAPSAHPSHRFSQIYITEEARQSDISKRIISALSDIPAREIVHYKDVFNLAHQDFMIQKREQSIILAVNKGRLVYPGAPVCQSFGNENFCYCSNVMGCVYDCEYCYLQGMYPSGNLVIFVNIKDYFREIDKLLEDKGRVYLCISYDTDLLALDGLTGLARMWCEFAAARPNLTIELRTKSAVNPAKTLPVAPNVIYAWTLSPKSIAARYEHFSAPVDRRINAAANAIKAGCTVRLCFDPLIYLPHPEKSDICAEIKNLIDEAFTAIPADKLYDVSIGSFRISSSYMKKFRNVRRSPITFYPYDNEDGVLKYPAEISAKLENAAMSALRAYISPDKIYPAN